MEVDQLIEAVLNDPDTGLLTTVSNELGQSVGRFQVRPWSFNGIFEGCGYRIGKIITESFNHSRASAVSFELKIAYLLEVTDEAQSQIEGLKLALRIDHTVFKYSRCGKITPIPMGDGGIQTRQDKNKSTSWYVVVLRQYIVELEYVI